MDALFVVTPTGLSAHARRQCEAAVIALRGTWSGALVLGGPPFRRTTHLLVGSSADPSSEKVRAALAAGLPIVEESWLEASAEQGFFLDWKRFAAQLAAQPEPACPPDLTAASTTAAGPSPGLCSPPERLREALPIAAAAGPFVALLQSPERTTSIEPKQAAPVLLQREATEAPPASPPAQHSPPALGWIPLPGVLAVGDNNDQAAAAAAERATADVTPLSAASSASGSGSAGSSSAKVMRFMSRAPQVTLVRGGAVRRCTSTPESSSWGGQECAGGSPAHGSRQSGAGTAAAAASTANSSGGEGTLVGVVPQRLRYSLAARRLLPDTTIALGPMLPSHRRPSLARLEGLRQHHGLRSLQGITFYASAQCVLQGGRRLTLVAGDACHGVRLLHDFAPDGSWLYARAIIMSIYTLPSDGEAAEVWMEHKFAFERSDMLERPAWAAALRCAATDGGSGGVGEEELFLSAGAYHSPLALVTGDFGLAYRGGGRLPAADAMHLPLFECRHGFDPTGPSLLSLQRALAGLLGRG